MMSQLQTSNVFKYKLYVTVGDGENISHFVQSFYINKKTTTYSFALDYIDVDAEAYTKALSYIGSEYDYIVIMITDVSDDLNGGQVIFENEYRLVAADAIPTGGRLYFDSPFKKLWAARSHKSYVYDSMDIKSALESYIEDINNQNNMEYHTYYTCDQDINKSNYEKIMIRGHTNLEALKEAASRYRLYDTPFYIYLDEYNFVKPGESPTKQKLQRIGFYNFTDPNCLRASAPNALNSVWKPIKQLNITESYIDDSIIRKYKETKYKFREPLKFISKKMVFDLNPDTSLSSIYVPDSATKAKRRIDKYKQFFDKSIDYYVYSLPDTHISSITIGDRFMYSEDPDAQKALGIVELEYVFSRETTLNVDEPIFSCSIKATCIRIDKSNV